MTHQDAINAQLGIPPEEPEDALVRWNRLRLQYQEPPSKAERKLDTFPLTREEIDQRIDDRVVAERGWMMERIAELVGQVRREAIAGPPGPTGCPGADADPEFVADLVEAAIDAAIARLPAPKDGAPGKDGESIVGPPGAQGPPGKLPLVKGWKPERVYYRGNVVTFDGGAYQATRDTGQPPTHTNWICIAAPGRSISICGTFDPNLEYREFDVVALGGSSFVARKDQPGPCPGAGWQLLASAGKRGSNGRRGEQGERGERGIPGPKGDPGLSAIAIRSWTIDRQRYVATPVMSDGSTGPPLELRPLFEQFMIDAS